MLLTTPPLHPPLCVSRPLRSLGGIIAGDGAFAAHEPTNEPEHRGSDSNILEIGEG